jgi:hypothetical protein
MPFTPPHAIKPPVMAAEKTTKGDRSTVVPEFDVQAFARHSEMRQRLASVNDESATIEQALLLHLDGHNEEALFVLARLLQLVPLHPEATRLSVDCRDALERQCWSEIGSGATVLIPSVSTEELKRYSLDNVSGFLLSLMDGDTDVEAIVDISGLPKLLALRHLRSLLERGIIVVASGLRTR